MLHWDTKFTMLLHFLSLLCISSPVSSLPTCLDHGVSDLAVAHPLIIAHRGACGVLPEHTIAAYQRAIDDGADVIECDVCVTRDLHLICIHESWLSVTTNIANMSHFSARQTRRTVDDYYGTVVDWFSTDFTLDELKSLRKVQKEPFRDQSFNLLYQIPTLDEVIDLVASASRPVGLHIETKNPTFVNQLPVLRRANTTMEQLLADLLGRRGYSRSDQACFLQSFEEGSLQRLSTLTQLPLVMLTWGTPPTDAVLTRWREAGFYGIGPNKKLIVPQEEEEANKFRVGPVDWAGNLAARAHRLGLKVHPYTYRNEDQFLAWNYSQDAHEEYKLFTEIGVDGYFTDFPATLSTIMLREYEGCQLSSATTLITTHLTTLATLATLTILTAARRL